MSKKTTPGQTRGGVALCNFTMQQNSITPNKGLRNCVNSKIADLDSEVGLDAIPSEKECIAALAKHWGWFHTSPFVLTKWRTK